MYRSVVALVLAIAAASVPGSRAESQVAGEVLRRSTEFVLGQLVARTLNQTLDATQSQDVLTELRRTEGNLQRQLQRANRSDAVILLELKVVQKQLQTLSSLVQGGVSRNAARLLADTISKDALALGRSTEEHAKLQKGIDSIIALLQLPFVRQAGATTLGTPHVSALTGLHAVRILIGLEVFRGEVPGLTETGLREFAERECKAIGIRTLSYEESLVDPDSVSFLSIGVVADDVSGRGERFSFNINLSVLVPARALRNAGRVDGVAWEGHQTGQGTRASTVEWVGTGLKNALAGFADVYRVANPR